MTKLKVHVLDVGQGAATVLDFGQARYGLVDCGGQVGTSNAAVVRFLRDARRANPFMRIVFLLITHLDFDHIRAIKGLFSDGDLRDRIERLYCNDLAYRMLLKVLRDAIRPGQGIGFNQSSRPALEVLQALGSFVLSRSAKANLHFEFVAPEASDPERYPVPLVVPGLGANVVLRLWAPSQRLRDEALELQAWNETEVLRAVFSGREIEQWNAASAVVSIDVGKSRILLTGDATSRTWEEILQRAGASWVGADAVVAWHHGGRLGTRGGFDHDEHVWSRVLRKDGGVVCISCGAQNRYRHPHDETLRAVGKCRAETYCTQRGRARRETQVPLPRDSGTMLLRSAAKALWVEETPDGRCCGDIILEVGDGHPLSVSYAHAGRELHDACCCVGRRSAES
jgi:beta-lactamase superfamily II metal-dependent hydrolase